MMITMVLALAAGTTAASPAAKQKDPNQQVCRSEYPLGSRIPERICKTRAEWDEIAAQTREELRRSGGSRSESHND